MFSFNFVLYIAAVVLYVLSSVNEWDSTRNAKHTCELNYKLQLIQLRRNDITAKSNAAWS